MKAQTFMDSVAVAAGLNRTAAEHTITVVLRALRERLDPIECGHIMRFVPEPFRHALLKGTKHRWTLPFTREEFVDRVCHGLDVGVAEALRRIRAVYVVLERAVRDGDPEEQEHLHRLIPPALREVLHVPGAAI